MKQLSSFMALSIDGGDRIAYTFNEINDDTGEISSTNNKGNFYILDEGLRSHVDAIRDYIKTNKLNN